MITTKVWKGKGACPGPKTGFVDPGCMESSPSCSRAPVDSGASSRIAGGVDVNIIKSLRLKLPVFHSSRRSHSGVLPPPPAGPWKLLGLS